MATSPVNICNQALIAIGVDPILSLSGVNKENKLCIRLYPLLRRQETMKHIWTHALKRTQ